MADNRDLASLTGNAATDERTINSVTVHVQRVGLIGNSGGTAGQVTVTNSSGTVVASRETRGSVTLLNNQPVPVFLDPGGNAASTASFRLDPYASVTFATTASIMGITAAAYSASGDAKVHYFETFDS